MCNYFVKWVKSFILIISTERESSAIFYNDMLDEAYEGLGQYVLQIVNVQKGERRRVDDITDFNMVLVDSYESFVATDLTAHTWDNDHNECYYIFLKRSDSMVRRDMQKIFEYCWRNHLINCNIQIQTVKGEMELYTYYPFTPQNCGKVEIIRINTFNGTSMSRTMTLFPNKLKNFYGCPLRVAVWNIPPFLSVTTDKEGTLQLNGGFEGRLLRLLSKRLNFKVEMQLFNESGRGKIFPNRTTTGVLKMLNDRQLDLAVGSYQHNAERNRVATSSINYYQSIISVVMLRSALRISKSEVLIHPFQTSTWLVLLLTSAIVVLVVYALRHLRHTPPVQPVTDVFVSMLGMPFVYMPPYKEMRVFAMAWIFFTMVLRSIYLGYLFHMIRSHLQIAPPVDFNDLVNRNFHIVFSQRMNNIIKHTSELQGLNYTILPNRPESYTLEYLLTLPKEHAKHTVGVSAIDYLQYNIRVMRKSEVFQIIPYDIIGFKTCIYMAKHSYLSNQLNDFLIWTTDFGLIEYWKKFQLDTGYINMKYHREDELFDMSELSMAFYAVILGDVVAIVVFLTEVFYHKYWVNKNNKL
ncbi:uncharacterized protein LOC133335955 [Musca vetustissima]|uniref:uncharacterized protein LOC133335955 n=1 Tax=Musca vetustissima TaxID=27455 RepID=UPI002AB782C4|nr:uncharacterized protein LOC133335955 [Musca vetustissima]